MSDFGKFARVIEAKFNQLAKGTLYVVDVERDQLWEKYMEAFPEGTNEVFRERRSYDCQTCRQFIKNIAGVVGIVNNQLVSIWDVEAEGYYNDVAKFMSEFVKSKNIKTKYMTAEPKFGAVSNIQVLTSGETLKFNHFHCVVPVDLVNRDYRTVLSRVESTKQVFNRGLDEITTEALEMTLELIAQGSLYRGDEFKAGVSNFLELKRKYTALDAKQRDIFVWLNVDTAGARIRNTAIGTLLQDLSEGKELEEAVKAFERVVAPTNYKRPKALVTQGMINSALKTIDELGIEDALTRRHAKLEDISVNDVLFADRTAKPKMQGVAGLLQKEVKANTKKLEKVEEIGIDDFLANVLPSCTSLEILLENKHSANLCNLVAPMSTDAKGIFKWGSNFSWSYNGNITDSMKQNVKAAGGNVEGVLRFSIQWNDNNDNNNDLDAHCTEPSGGHIYYGNPRGAGLSGTLDVDIRQPNGKVAVENIIYTDISKMRDGTYRFLVNNYSGTSGRNFTAEVEFNGVVHSYSYEGLTKGDMQVAEVTLKNGEFSIKHLMQSSQLSKEIWGLSTLQFHKVNLVTLSPNFWNEKEIGNKHFMFILDECKNPESVRGFYNEFLDNSLNDHRKVFEVLASKMQCPYEEQQLAGLGFSSTQRNDLTVKVQGAFTRTLKIKF